MNTEMSVDVPPAPELERPRESALPECPIVVTEPISNHVPIVVQEVNPPVHGEFVGCVKWFSNNIGYGFVTVYTEGEMKGRDVFVHHSGVRPLNSNYRTLQKGEYISFDLGASDNGKQAINVTGVYGGPLMCDHRPSFQQEMASPPRSDGFTQAKGRRKDPCAGNHVRA